MTPRSPAHEPELSLVVAVSDAEEHVAGLIERAVAALRGVVAFEVLFVDDASRDQTVVQLRNALDYYPELRVLCHAQQVGTSAALRSGIEAARAAWVAILGGGEHTDPRPLRTLLAARATRSIDAQLYVLRDATRPSWFELLGQALGSRPGTGPSAEPPPTLLERSTFLALPHFEGMHRVLSALVMLAGGQVLDVVPPASPGTPASLDRPRSGGPGAWLARRWARQAGRRSPVAELHRY